MSKPKWFTVGQEAVDKRLEEEAEKVASNRQNIAFKIKPSETGKFTLLCTPEVLYWAHTIPRPTGGFVEYTCLGDTAVCPMCKVLGRGTDTLVATCIDHMPWEDKMGKKHKYSKKLIKFRGDGILSIRNLTKKNGGDLTFYTIEATRGKNKQSPASGSFFTLVKKQTKEALMKVCPPGEESTWLEPFDYLTLFEPKSAEEMRAALGTPAPIGATKEEDPLDELGGDSDLSDFPENDDNADDLGDDI
jgi:hypothetical protein